MSFVEELKRRNVFRVAVAYGVAAWVILQVADLVLDNVEAPGWVMDVFMLVTVLGFLVVVVIAWAYEITPEGIKKESEVDRSQSITHMTGKRLDRVIILFLVLAVAVLLIDRSMTPAPEPVAESVNVAEQASEPAEVPIAAEPSIAVLPFVNMSADEEQEYFSDGISEELLNLLVRVEGLKVASRTSSFIYKGENLNIPAIAAELKVNHILEGSVRKAGNRVRITAQLIDTSDDRHLWSDTFDRELDDIFAIQDEIANSIVDALKSELGIGLESVNVAVATENLDAYDLYLRGRSMFIARQSLDVANRLLEQATQLDPEFALAWEVLAASQSVSDSWLIGDGIDHRPLAEVAAKTALEIDPGLSLAYAVLAQYESTDGDVRKGMELMDTAIANDPKNATAWLWRGIRFRELGHFQRAADDFDRCLVIDPAYHNCRSHKAGALLFAGRVDEAVTLLKEIVADNFHSTNDEFVAHFVQSGDRTTAHLLIASSVLGNYAPAKYLVQAIENPGQPNTTAEAHWIRYVEANNIDACFLGAVIVAFRWDHCYSSGVSGASTILWHPDAAYFRQTPEFKELAEQRFLPYWRAHGFPPQCRDLGDGGFECD